MTEELLEITKDRSNYMLVHKKLWEQLKERNSELHDKIFSAVCQAYSAGVGEGLCRKHIELDEQGFFISLGVTNPEQMNFIETDALEFIKASQIMKQFEKE